MSTPPPPSSASEPEAPPAASRRSPAALVAVVGGAAALVLVIAIVVILQLTANGAYDRAIAAWDEADDDRATVQAEVAAEATTGAETAAGAAAIVAAAPDGLVDTAARDGLGAAAPNLTENAEAASTAAADETADATGARPVVFWELLGEADALQDEADAIDRDAASLDEQGEEVATSADEVDAAASALYASADAAGAGFVSQHVNARNAEVLAFRAALDDLSSASGVGIDAQDAMAAYASAATGVTTSEQDELASLGGRLYDAKLAAQDFARSLENGVLLEFDWSDQVPGSAGPDAIAGYTTWWFDRGGYAVMQLTNAVAALWPDAVAQNLIAHEVGHVMSAKCPDLYDNEDQASIEAFATGWAISRGYLGNGNGVSIYGQPAQSVIDAAATCQ